MPNTTNFNWPTPADTDYVTNGALAMRDLGDGIDTSLVDLKGGTTGQVLAKASNTDLDYTWTTPNPGDVTAVNVTSPLTGGGTGGDVTVGIQDGTTTQKGAVQLEDSTASTSTTKAATPNSVKSAYDLANGAIAKTTVTTAGDIIYRNGSTPTRLGIGTAGQVLTVNSGATAPEWATPAGGGGLTLLSTTTLSGSATTISSIAGGYKRLSIIIKGMYQASDVGVLFSFNGDTGSNYAYNWMRNVDGTYATGYNNPYTSVSGFMAGNNSGAKSIGSSQIEIPLYTSTDYINYQWTSWGGGNGSQTVQWRGAGSYDCSAAITSITFTSGGSTFSGGTVYVYGVN